MRRLRFARVACLAAVLGAAAGGEPECTLESCLWSFDEHQYGDARWVLDTLGVRRLLFDQYNYLLPHMCNAENWNRASHCQYNCPLALEVTHPPELRMRACLADNEFLPYSPDGHIDLNHPLNGRELELAIVGTPGSTEREGCSQRDLIGRNFSGKIVLVRRGGCRFDLKGFNVAAAGGLATVIVDHNSNNAISMSGITGESYGVESVIVTKMPRHYGDYIAEALDAGQSVRGKLSLNCDSITQPPEAGQYDTTCPNAELAGLCTSAEKPEDQLCNKCPAELLVYNETFNGDHERYYHNWTLCLWSNNLMPKMAKNDFAANMTAGERRKWGDLVLADLVPGFLPDPNCRDNPNFVEPLSGYDCAFIANAINGGQLPACDWLLQFGFSSSMVQGFMDNCYVTCPKSVGGVGCSGGTGEGCISSDFANAAGKIVAVTRPSNCLPIQLATAAERAGVRGVVLLSASSDTDATLTEGLSLFVGIPVHAMQPGESRNMRAWLRMESERTGGAPQPAWVSLSEIKYVMPPTPAPEPPQERLSTVEGSTDFQFTTTVIVCIAIGAVLLVLCLAKFIEQRLSSVSLPRVGSAGSNTCTIPLSLASMGLSLSLLMLIAVVSFVLTYRTGKETTDSALDDGWLAVEKTHLSAVMNVGELKDQLLTSIVNRARQGVKERLDEGKLAAQSLAKVFMFQDGTWDTFDRTVPLLTELSSGYGTDTNWALTVRTVQGFFASSLLKTDDRPNLARGDGHEHVSVTNNGFLYGLNKYTYSPGGNLFEEHFPREVWDPHTSVGRTAVKDVVNWLDGVRKMIGVWWDTSYAFPVTSSVAGQLGSRPLSCFTPIYSPTDRYIGVAEAYIETSWFGQFVGYLVTSPTTQNMTLVMFVGEGNLVTISAGRYSRRIDDFGTADVTSGEISVPLTLEGSHKVELNAASHYLRSQLNGSLSNFALVDQEKGLSGEFDQADWYDRGAVQSFVVFHFSFDDSSLRDTGGQGFEGGFSGSLSYAPSGARGTAAALQLDGQSTFEVFINLTTDIPRVAELRNTSRDDYRPTYLTTRPIPGGKQAVAWPRIDDKTETLRWATMTREPVLTESFSLMMWVRPDEAVDDSPWVSAVSPRLFSDTLNSGAAVRLHANGKLVVRGSSDTYGCETSPITGGPAVGQWTHIAAVVDRVMTSTDAAVIGRPVRGIQQCVVYVDGREHSRVDMGVGVVSFGVDKNYEPLRLGQFFKGAIDEVMMLNNTLVEAEVASIKDTGVLKRSVPSRKWYLRLTNYGDILLDWAIVGIIPRQDIMGEVDRLNALQRQNQTIRRQNTENKLSQSSAETMLIIVCIALASILLFLVFNDIMTQPFAVFARQMTDVAIMKVETVDAEPGSSMLREIDSMHRAMALMVRNLKEYKSYMPQTMLALNDATDSDEETEAGTEHGDQAKEQDRAKGLQQSKEGGSGASFHVGSDDKSLHSGLDPRSVKSLQGGVLSSSASQRTRQQSHVSHNVGKAKKAEAAIRIGTSLTSKRCSFLAINATAWHQTLDAVAPDAVVAFHAKYVEIAVESFTAFKGVPDTFCGDRMFCSFNAVRPFAAHRQGVCSAAMVIRSKVGEDVVARGDTVKGMKVSIAVVSGEARVGNMGTDTMRRFTFVSSVITWCYALERYARHLNALTLADQYVRDEAKTSFTLRDAGAVTLRKRREGRPLDIFEMLGVRAAAAEEEWMYQLEQQDKEDTWKGWNTWVNLLTKGEWSAAEENLAAAIESDKTIEPRSGLVDFFKQVAESSEYSVPVITFH